MINTLKKDLEGREVSFLALDCYMQNKDYYSVYDDGVTENIKQDKNIIYTSMKTNAAEIIIDFDITIDNGIDEIEESFYLKVNSVEMY